MDIRPIRTEADYEAALAEIERLTILQTLQRTNWNKQEAASILGLYRPTLYSKMRRHDINDPRSPAAVVDEG